MNGIARLPAGRHISEGAVRILDMFQNRFGAGFFAALINRLPAPHARDPLESPVSRSASMRFQSRLPATLLCAIPDEWNRLRQAGGKLRLVVNNLN